MTNILLIILILLQIRSNYRIKHLSRVITGITSIGAAFRAGLEEGVK